MLVLGSHADLAPSESIGVMGQPFSGDAAGEPASIRRLRTASRDLVAAVEQLGASPGDKVRHLVGLPAIICELRRVEQSAATSSWVLQPRYSYDPEDPGVELAEKARERGVDTELVTRPASVRTHPLLSSIFPRTWVGPCFVGAMVVDERVALIAGEEDLEGNRTSWVTELPDVVDAAVALWHATLEECRPILPPGARPPLTPRQLDVARMLCVGEKDKAIARLLSLSSRTVEREVAVVYAALGARSRTEAVLLMRGRGVNGGSVR